MADQAPAPEEPATRAEDRIESVRVRRAPKISVFLALGAGVGILVALILTFSFGGASDVSPNTGLVYTQGQVFGFLALICITAGVALGAVVALILDRRSSKHTREVRADHESVHTDEP
ncbi:potassium transporter Trk [Microbacterium sp.]|uniref:potassium transporter Trk n=1 Tax=Microbacterium sp. TaxID=51671 RepID=UPI003F6EF49E